MSNQSLSPLGLGYAAAILAATSMLLISILANLGIYTGAAEMMQQWHMFFNLSITGTIIGIIEAAIISFVGAYIFGLIYNKTS